MATDKPLVSVYMPQDLLDRLKQYQQDNDIKSASSAVVAALQEFFKLGETAAYAPIERVEELEQRLNQLSELVEELRRSPVRQQSSTQPATPQNRPRRTIAPSADESTAASSEGWLNQQQVAEMIGVHKSTLASKRQEMSEEEFIAYLDSKSSQRWEFDRSLGKAGMYRAIEG